MIRAALVLALVAGISLAGSSAAQAASCSAASQTFPIAIALREGTAVVATLKLGPETTVSNDVGAPPEATTCVGGFTVEAGAPARALVIGRGTFKAIHTSRGLGVAFSGTLFGRTPFVGRAQLSCCDAAVNGTVTTTFTTVELQATVFFTLVDAETLLVNGVVVSRGGSEPGCPPGYVDVGGVCIPG